MARIIVPERDSVFHFRLPEDGLSLHSAGFSDVGAPELRFIASPKVPTLQEGDVATIFRLVNENKRPNFYYVPFPIFHPLHHCRNFMEYSPSWLRWTGVGKLLADADWNMKCLHVGVRTNEDKTVFKSWPLSSNLEGLATHLDFPRTDIGRVMMTCEHVTTSEKDGELVFIEDPKMKITDDGNLLYSEYITEHYPAVAYYDEPVFLKMQELMKLIVTVEWLHEKGVKANQEWMMNHTSKFKREVELNRAEKPPFTMIPQPSSYERPSKDVTVNTYDSSCNKAIAKHTEQYYGYVDFSGAEVKAFKADGTEIPPVKCLKVFIEDKLEFHETVTGWIYVPLPLSKTVGNFVTDSKDEIIKVWGERQKKRNEKAPLSNNHRIEDLSTEEDEIKVRLTDTLKLHPSADTSVKRTLIITATVNNYGVFPEKYLKIPPLCNEGLIIPDVKSWEELINDLSVPIPAFWQDSIDGIGIPTATGGVSTSSFEHRRVPHSVPSSSARVSQPTTSSKRVSLDTSSFVGGSSCDTTRTKAMPKIIQHGTYSSNGQVLSVSGTVSLFEEISKKFCNSWIGNGDPPEVQFVFQINNKQLEKQWNDYKRANQQQEHKMLYHGTSVCETITTPTGQLCCDPKCGICGISSNGMCLEFAGNSFPEFQRFGKGIYLAPNSSKADEYTEKNRNDYRAMLFCDVLLGRQHIIKDGDSEDIKGPSRDFDSIVVKPGKHRVPEIVVFDERAVLPRYIIVYKKSEGKQK